MAPDLGWLHRYVPPDVDAAPIQGDGAEEVAGVVPAGVVTLLLLHGSGGDENSLLGFGRLVAPTANLLSVRGRSVEEGFHRFFRRSSATGYDQDNIVSEARALGEFARLAADTYGFNPRGLVACGYANGADIALAAMAYDPDVFSAAVLLRGVMPLEQPPEVNLDGKPILLLMGARDPYAPQARDVAPYLSRANARLADVSVASGHELVEEDVKRVSDWLETFGRGVRSS